MAPPSHSNHRGPSAGYGLPPPAYGPPGEPSLQSTLEDLVDRAQALYRRMQAYGNSPAGRRAWHVAARVARQIRLNLAAHRLLSFPHLLVGFWVLVMLWGERWTFASKVRSCDWDRWEYWPKGATPHRLIFVADPQIIDPHSYPGRPWPLNPLTMTITDNYMRRSYTQLQEKLRPDTVLFLGDLFDGGREWKTAHGDSSDPEWAKNHRPAEERKHLKQWNKKYGEDYWLKEYGRFGDIFYDTWPLGGQFPGRGQRGRKVISSLPGNHDLGFGAEVKVPVRDRFEAFFGDLNRVDVIGNHTFVSVDTVSLSADTSQMKDKVDLSGIYGPVNEFLDQVQATKRRAVAKELKFWRGEPEEVRQDHKVEDIKDVTAKSRHTLDEGEGAADFPTVLLTHVPLYRDPGTPCGPMREHWPPAKPPKGQAGPVVPDHGNAIRVAAGYQYQNVLNEADSVRLVRSVGNVVHAFSGDDHDYCEVVHSAAKEHVREITVKSLSMAMGVPSPGFQMVSLWNPVDAHGRPLPGAARQTLQTHLCLLPKQLATYTTYAALGILTLFVLVARAVLVPVLGLQPFALAPSSSSSSSSSPDGGPALPLFKEKVEAEPENGLGPYQSQSSGHYQTSNNYQTSNLPSARTSRGRTPSVSHGGLDPQRAGHSPRPKSGKGAKRSPNGRWNANAWASRPPPRIDIRRGYGDGGAGDAYWKAAPRPGSWRAAVHSRTALLWREVWTSAWRVIWMVAAFFAYLTYQG